MIRVYYTPNTWNFPRWVAKKLGYFEQEGISVELVEHDTAHTQSPNIYERRNVELLASGKIDLYSACDWGTIKRVGETGVGRIVVQRAAASNLPYSIYVRPRSKITSMADLANTPVAMKNHSGSHYATIEMLERTLPPDEITVSHVGKPVHRLEALINGDIDAATLMGPMIAVADHLGLRRVATLSTGGAFVGTTSLNSESVDTLLSALNRAVRTINAEPEAYRDHFAEMARAELRESEDLLQLVEISDIENEITVPRYDRFMRFPDPDTIEEKLNWMKAHGLIGRGVEGEELLAD